MKKINRKKWFKECVAASVLLLAFPLAVFAGIGEKIFSFGPRAAYSTPKDADSGQWFGGAQARLHVSPGMALEASIDYRRNDFGRLTTIKSYPVQASILAYLMPGADWSPFLIGGGGWYYTQVDGPAGYSKTDYRFGLHAGAGLELLLNESVSLDASYRYVWLESVKSKDETATDKTFQDSGSTFTVGLNFLF